MNADTQSTAETALPGFDSAEQEVFLNLWRTYDCLKALEDELFGGFELSAQQYNALRLLEAAHPEALPSQAIGRRLISRSPDTTRMLDRLDKRRLIRRKRRADNRRVVEVMITAAGLALLKKLAPQVTAMHARQLGHLSRTEQKSLATLLRQARLPHEDASCDWLDS